MSDDNKNPGSIAPQSRMTESAIRVASQTNTQASRQATYWRWWWCINPCFQHLKKMRRTSIACPGTSSF